MLRLSESGGTM